MPRDVTEAILHALRSMIIPDIEDLAAYAGVTPATARKHLKRLIEAGLVHRERVLKAEGGSHRWFYFLSEGRPDGI
jgi:DNA-binding MarR family transcriptional regulator